MAQQVVAKFSAGNKPALKSWVLLIGAWLTIGLAVVANGRRRVSFDSGDIGSDSEMSYGYNPWEQHRRPYVYCSPHDYEWCCDPQHHSRRQDGDLGKSIEIAECLIKYVKNSYVGHNRMPRECCSIPELSDVCYGQGNGNYQSLNAIKRRPSGQLTGRSYSPLHGCPSWKARECCGPIGGRAINTGVANRQENLFQAIIQCLTEIMQMFQRENQPSEIKIPKVCCKIPLISAICAMENQAA